MHQKISESKQKIINSSLILFVKKGISGTTTKDIAKAAGIAEGTIYKHYKSKGDLAYELFATYMVVFREMLEKSIRDEASPSEKLTSVIDAFFEFAIKQRIAYEYIMLGHYSEIRKMPVDMKKPKDLFADIVTEGINTGVFKNIEVNLGTAHIIGMVTRTILFNKNKMLNTPYDEMVSETVTSALKILEA